MELYFAKVDHLESILGPGDLLGDFHCLLHADDTVILSTDRDTFIRKYSAIVDYFRQNLLTLNMAKSGYMAFNEVGANKSYIKCSIVGHCIMNHVILTWVLSYYTLFNRMLLITLDLNDHLLPPNL